MRVGLLTTATLAWLAIVAVHARARAGNDEGFLLGNQAALTGGAVTADVAEGSAIWYNPAGLAAVRTPSLDLSASAYGIRTYSAPGFLRASTGASIDLKVSELIIVPTALSLVRPLGPSRARTADAAPLHFYGGSVGVRWGKRYRVQSERPKTFEFSSTLAVRYAVGRGLTQGLGVAALDGSTEPVSSPWSRLVVHELMLHLGSGFYF